MYRLPILDFLQRDCAFFVTKAIKQHWSQTRYSYRTKPRPDNGLMLLLHGEIKLLAGDGVLTARAGDVVFLPKSSHYEAVFEREAEDYLVNFDGPEGALEISAPVRLLQNAPFSCSEAFAALVEERLSGDPSSLRFKGLLYMLLDSIVTGANGESRTVEKAKKLLSGEELKISEIANRCGISESGFRKEFKAETGLSPTEYRLDARITKAKYLLESTDMNVSEIADALRFYDAAYFCRMFKLRTGLSPMQFAKRKQL